MRDHAKLRGFDLADEVAILIYRITREFPKEEIYGLTSQADRLQPTAYPPERLAAPASGHFFRETGPEFRKNLIDKAEAICRIVS